MCSSRQVDEIALPAKADLRLRFDDAGIESEQNVVDRVESLVLALQLIAGERQVVAAENDVLRRNGDRLAACRREQVVRRKHQNARLDLRLGRQRNVNRHLVAVKVGVERRADERMDLDRLTLDKHRLESLDAETVKRRSTVQKNRMLANDFLENVPDDRLLPFDHFACLFDRGGVLRLFQACCR